MKLKDYTLVIILPFEYERSGFENQIKALGLHFHKVAMHNFKDKGLINYVRNFKKYKKEIEQIIDFYKFLEESTNDKFIYMTFVPGCMKGLLITKLFRKHNCKCFIRTHSDLVGELKANRGIIIGTVLSPIINFVFKRNIKDVLNFSSGRILYPKLRNQHAILSTSHNAVKIVEKTKKLKEPLTLLYIGKLERKKGVEYLIYALPDLKRSYTLDIIGSGKEESRLKKIVKSLELTKYVNFHGYKPLKETESFYKKADIFIAPSIEEMQGKTWLEALSYGTPVVATNIAGVNGYMVDDVNALLVKPKSSYAIAAAIDFLLNYDDAIIKSIRANGYKLAKQNSCKIHAEKIAKIVEKILC